MSLYVAEATTGKQMVMKRWMPRARGRVGRIEEVLVEGVSRRDEGRVSGRTRQGKLIHFAPPADGLRPGSLAAVRVDHGAPHHLLGSYVETLRGPRHKIRIPLTTS